MYVFARKSSQQIIIDDRIFITIDEVNEHSAVFRIESKGTLHVTTRNSTGQIQGEEILPGENWPAQIPDAVIRACRTAETK